MLHPDLKRLRQLRAKYAANKGPLSIDEIDEMYRLEQDRERAIARMIPTPTCCAAGRSYPAVTFEVPDYEGRRLTSGYWHAHMSRPLAQQKSIGPDGSEWLEKMPVAKFCPFCGAALPEMVRKDPPPTTVRVVLDGGYYCSNCNDRLDGCLCDPPAFAFEPQK